MLPLILVLPVVLGAARDDFLGYASSLECLKTGFLE